MKWNELKLRLRRLRRPAQAERDLHEEVDFHLAMAAHKGVRPEAAFGGSDRIIEECRDLRRLGWLEDGWRDLILGLRRMRQAPVFSLVAVGTLALGIGANTALFSLIDAILLRPLPVAHPEQLVSLGDPGWTGTASGVDSKEVNGLTFHQFELIRQQCPEFDGVLAQESNALGLQVQWGGRVDEQPTNALMVSANYFAMLGVSPIRGHFFDAVEDTPAAVPEAVISYAYWQSRFGGADSVLGQQVQVYGRTYTVIGVAPKGFFGAKVGVDPALYFPIELQPQLIPGRDELHDPPGVERTEWINVIGRLKPGVTVQEATVASNIIFHRTVLEQAAAARSAKDRNDVLSQTLPVSAIPTGLSSVRASAQQPLLVLLGLVGLILALVVVNLGGITAAQAAGRQREVEMRLALGASRGRLLRQLLTESGLLAAIGGTSGWVLGRIGVAGLLQLISGNSPVDLAVDWRVLGFTFAICIASALGFGLLPALRLSRLRLGRSVRAGRQRLGRATVVAQVAVALVLVMSAALFVRSLQQLQQVDIGYNPSRLTRFYVNATAKDGSLSDSLQVYRRLTTALARVPGVQAATFSENGLFSGRDSGDDISVEGSAGAPVNANWDEVAPGYFATLGVPLVLGREFTLADETLNPRPMIIDTVLAKQYFGGRNPIGQHVTIHESASDVVTQVIGVSAVAQQQSLRAKPYPRFYLDAFSPYPDLNIGVTFVLRARDTITFNQIRAAVAAVAPNLWVRNLKTLDSTIDDTITPDLTLAKLSGFFAVLALIMAAMGLYGMLAYAVSRRQAEIGVRMALGAAPGEIRGLFLREAALLVSVGLLLGVGGSVLAGRALASLLFQLNPMDVTSLAIAAAALAATALLASWLPALRASRLDPVRTLRQE